MRAAIYARVSKDARGESRSVAEQEAECRAWCEREGWDVVGVWTDNDLSASRYATRERLQWRALVEQLDGGGVDLLVCWEPSRATRDRLVWATLAATCLERTVRLGVNGRVYDLADPDDAFALDLFFALAVRESGSTSKRVQRAMRAGAAAGRPHGKILYGYRREYTPSPNGKPALVGQVPDPVTAPVVQEIARRVLSGETPYRVAQDLNERGVPTPRGAGRWDLTQVRRVCVNPSYIGKRTHQGKIVGDAAWPPILDEATHATLVAKLSDPARRNQRDSAVRWLLSGVAVCAVCEGPIRVLLNRGRRAYLCKTGFHVSRVVQEVDDLVTVAVVDRLSRPDLVDLMASREDDAARRALTEARALRDRLTGFYDAAAAGDLTAAALARIEAQLLPAIEQAERAAHRSVVGPVLAQAAGPDAAERWERLTLPQRREVVRTLAEVRIGKAGAGRRIFRPETIEIVWRS